MSKLLAAVFAAMFALGTLGTVSAFAAEPTKAATKKVDCKDVKNKAHKDCVKAAAPAKK